MQVPKQEELGELTTGFLNLAYSLKTKFYYVIKHKKSSQACFKLHANSMIQYLFDLNFPSKIVTFLTIAQAKNGFYFHFSSPVAAGLKNHTSP